MTLEDAFNEYTAAKLKLYAISAESFPVGSVVATTGNYPVYGVIPDYGNPPDGYRAVLLEHGDWRAWSILRMRRVTDEAEYPAWIRRYKLID